MTHKDTLVFRETKGRQEYPHNPRDELGQATRMDRMVFAREVESTLERCSFLPGD